MTALRLGRRSLNWSAPERIEGAVCRRKDRAGSDVPFRSTTQQEPTAQGNQADHPGETGS